MIGRHDPDGGEQVVKIAVIITDELVMNGGSLCEAMFQLQRLSTLRYHKMEETFKKHKGDIPT
jgi:hypothetical protein